jgi:glyoxylase-like metal-dependent hydrolase (beta-lactamase superfamily II)
MDEVIPGVFQLSGIWGTGVWGANVFLLVGNNLTLVDTGFKGRSAGILKEVRRLGYSPCDIAHIIITHHHADHVGGLAALNKVTPARVVAHPADAPYIDGRLPQPSPARARWPSKVLAPLHGLWDTTPVTVDVLVDDGDELPILGGIKVLHMPGHTPGGICLFLPQERLVIAGDVLARRFGLRLPSKAFTVDIAQEIRSIKRLANLDFGVICFGHGSPIMHDARSVVIKFAETLGSKQEAR